MSGQGYPIDRAAALKAGAELARVTEIQRTRPADVAHVRLPLALEVLDHCAGDPVLAICLMATLVDPAAITHRLRQQIADAPATPAAPRGLHLVPAASTPTRRNA